MPQSDGWKRRVLSSRRKDDCDSTETTSSCRLFQISKFIRLTSISQCAWSSSHDNIFHLLTRPSFPPADSPSAGSRQCTWYTQATGLCVPVVPSSRPPGSPGTRLWSCGRCRSSHWCSSVELMNSSTSYDLDINDHIVHCLYTQLHVHREP